MEEHEQDTETPSASHVQLGQTADSPTATLQAQCPGWYRHPTRGLEHRYWDGTAWHDQVETLAAELSGAAEPPMAPDRPAACSGPDHQQAMAVGELWWDIRTDALRWSGESAALHGYVGRPRETTWEFMLSHVTETDREDVVARAEGCRQGAPLLHSRHRIVRVDGVGRDVLLVASAADPWTPQAFRGFLVELGSPTAVTRRTERPLRAAQDGTGVTAGAIRGLSLGYGRGIDLDDVLAGLRRMSALHGVRIPLLAGWMQAAIQTLGTTATPAPSALRGGDQ